MDRAARIARRLLPVLAVAGAASWFQPAIGGGDLFWHLAAGRQIWAEGGVPSVDGFSHTFAGEVWMNHEWIWGALYWRIYQLHPEAVAWFNLAVVTTIFAAAFARARRISSSLWASGAAIWIAAACSHWYIDIRPHLFTLLLLHVVLLTSERRWAPLLWPPLMALWANLHGGFVFGFGAIGLLVLVRTIEASVGARRLVIPRREWLAVLLCVPAMLMNPWGWRIFEYPLQYMPLPGKEPSLYSSILEWRPMGFTLEVIRYRGLRAWLGTYEGGFWLAAIATFTGALFALLPSRRFFYPVALCAVTLAMALTARRFAPLFAVTAVPLMAVGFAAALGAIGRRQAWLRHPALQLAATAGVAGLVLFLWQDVRLRPDFLARWTQPDKFPQAAARLVRDLGPLRALNYYNWGGYLMLEAPNVKTFMDGRANTLYDEDIYWLYTKAANGSVPAVQRALELHPADIAVVRAQGSLKRGLMELSPPWELVYSDARAAVLIPPDGRLEAADFRRVSKVLRGVGQYEVELARADVMRGSVQEAIARLERVLDEDPTLFDAWQRRAGLALLSGGVDAMNAVIEEGVRALPRHEHAFRRAQATFLQNEGHDAEALERRRQALRGDPFAYPLRDVRRLVALERRLAAGGP